MDLEVLELKRKLGLRKEKYKNGLSKLFRYFNIKNEDYLNDYDKMSDRMVELGIELKKVRLEMSSLDNDFERFKLSILLKENIDLSKEIFKFDEGVRARLLDELYDEGFIDTEYWDIIKNLIWENRYKKVFSD